MGRFLNPKALRASSEGKARGTSFPGTPILPRRDGEGARLGSGDSAISGEAVNEGRLRGASRNTRPGDRPVADVNARGKAPWQQSPAQTSGLAANEATAAARPRPVMVTVGNIALFLYLISGELNDLSHHFIGVNAYVSWFSEGLIVIALLTSGSGLRFWKLSVGKLWIALLVLMAASIPSSEWPSYSLHTLVDYFMRSTVIFCAVCAFVVDARTLQTAILGEVVNGVLLLISCVTMGVAGGSGGRFTLGGSYFYGNANDLALGLTIAAGFFLYWTIQTSVFKVALGSFSLLTAVYFLMRTGSRGGFLALAILLVTSVIFSARYRWRIIPVLLLAPLLVLVVPSELTHRLSFIVLDTSNVRVHTNEEAVSLASQQERAYMFWRSVDLMLTHPVFGVGLSCFTIDLYREDLEERKHTASLGTHNSYTQIGCECGIPALLVYLSILWISVRRTYRVFRESTAKPGLEEFPAAALCMISTLTGLSAALFFFHDAYTPMVPILTGLMVGIGQAFQHERALLEAPAEA
jgi:hypothetical protein